jgi:hypothetical protein
LDTVEPTLSQKKGKGWAPSFWSVTTNSREEKMTTDELLDQQKPKRFQLGLDWWAVLTALALAIVIKLGFIHKVPW